MEAPTIFVMIVNDPHMHNRLPLHLVHLGVVGQDLLTYLQLANCLLAVAGRHRRGWCEAQAASCVILSRFTGYGALAFRRHFLQVLHLFNKIRNFEIPIVLP
jgi:hypothetical protein